MKQCERVRSVKEKRPNDEKLTEKMTEPDWGLEWERDCVGNKDT